MAKTIKIQKIIELLAKANCEAQVEDAYMKLSGIDELERPYGCDGLNNGILFEFKLDETLESSAGMKAISQSAYYVHHLVTNGVYKGKIYQPPTTVAICDRNQAICFPANSFERYIHDNRFDWTRSASSPDPELIATIAKDFSDIIIHDMTNESGVQAFQDSLSHGNIGLQQITRENFDRIFEEWKKHFVPNKEPQEAALAFLLDLQMQGIKDEASGRIVLRCEVATNNTTKYFDIRVPISKYETFWATYQRPPSNEEMAKIIERKDRLVVMQLRRTTGEFFTPLEYSSLAHEYLANTIPDRYEGNGPHHSMYDDYNWWDPCCGTGNLTLECPPNMSGKLFMSTLNQEDIDVIKHSGQNLNATIFQFDFLNQGDNELPSELIEALKNGRPWIFILNPPYSAGTDMKGATGKTGPTGKAGISDTDVGSKMRSMKMDSACQNPMSQFVFKITDMAMSYEINAKMGLFSSALLWVGGGLEEFRTLFRKQFSPIGGFCFHCSEFQGTSGAWPVVYTIWQTGSSDEKIVLNILNGPDTIVGQKEFSPTTKPLSKWVHRPKNTITRPAMNGALGIVDRQSVRLDRLAVNALGFFGSNSNDVQQSSVSFLTSGPNHCGNGWSIIPENFYNSMVCFAARKLVISSWVNWQDQFSVPDTTLPNYDKWSIDAIVWSLFHVSNQTSSLGNVAYKSEIYDIPNEFFWMPPEEIMQIDGLPRSIWQKCRTAQPRFVSTWLEKHQHQFSSDTIEVLNISKKLIKVSTLHRMNALPKFQLDRWDAGWYQIRMGLYGKKDIPFKQTEEMMALMEQFKIIHKQLGDRLQPMIYTFGFLPSEKMIKT